MKIIPFYSYIYIYIYRAEVRTEDQLYSIANLDKTSLIYSVGVQIVSSPQPPEGAGVDVNIRGQLRLDGEQVSWH